jgi:AcrR family transcriptional regulator
MPGTAPNAAGVSRRDRLRAEVTEQIIDIGRRQLEQGGVSNVNWRAIAAEIGMNPASLYTYVDGINDLYTRILGRSFRSLADAIQTAERSAGSDARTRLLACATAYRTWALDHPREFNLIFTDQIPGYAAPSQGDTADAETAVNMPFVRALQEMLGESETQHPASLSGDLATIGYELRSLIHGFDPRDQPPRPVPQRLPGQTDRSAEPQPRHLPRGERRAPNTDDPAPPQPAEPHLGALAVTRGAVGWNAWRRRPESRARILGACVRISFRRSSCL